MGVTGFVQENRSIYLGAIELSLREISYVLYARAACAAVIVRTQDAQCKTKESP